MSVHRDVSAVDASDASGSYDDKAQATYVADTPPNPEDPAAPSKEVSSKRQRISDLVTIIAAGAGLASDGYQNNLMHVWREPHML
jgi:hypothetical protein